MPTKPLRVGAWEFSIPLGCSAELNKNPHETATLRTWSGIVSKKCTKLVRETEHFCVKIQRALSVCLVEGRQRRSIAECITGDESNLGFREQFVGQTYVTKNLCRFVMAWLDYPLGSYTLPKSTDAPGITGCWAAAEGGKSAQPVTHLDAVKMIGVQVPSDSSQQRRKISEEN